MLVFLVLLFIIAIRSSIRDEPTGVLVILLTLLGFVIAFTLFTISTADLVTGEATPLPFCTSLLSFGIGAMVAFKMNTLFLAVDQFVAVVHSLRYFTIMNDWVHWMVGMTCGCLLFFGMLGLVCSYFGLENTAEFHQRVFDVKRHLTQCSWEKMSGVYMLFVEASFLVLAISASSLVIYTAVIGMRQEKRILEEQQVTHHTRRFLMSFKSFKQIVKVLLVLLAIDILFCSFRIASRWFPQSTAATLFHLLRFPGLVIECWTFGLGHATIRSQVQKYLPWRRRESSERDPAASGLPPLRLAWT